MQIRKPHIAYFLIVIVLSFTIKSAFFMSYYAVFTDTFIENFCVNQDNEELQCDGKCYLSKVLDQDDSSEEKRFEIHAEKDLVFSITSFENPKNDVININHSPNYIYNNFYNYLFSQAFLKPPLVS
ncbi:hypothetical protein [Psychroflexus halocasei]|uniref:Uncharacterized protein n=1 Tax=Psychroflexus halocasei TaxID=908615 RepID=A0A1H3XGY5_9FLAO|nr:hypothetical protein [Psychroflexus halocasei]SDZ98480.1 hypothetical protein SAMN05421540_102356 [Psychroflexus halocasei]